MEKKEIDLTKAESTDIETLIKITNELKGEAFKKNLLASVMMNTVSDEIRKLAKKYELKGEEFEYRDGKIISVVPEASSNSSGK